MVGREKRIRIPWSIKNFRQIAKQVSTVYRALYKNDKGMSATRLVDIAHDTLEGMTEFIPEAAEYAERLYEISFEMEISMP